MQRIVLRWRGHRRRFDRGHGANRLAIAETPTGTPTIRRSRSREPRRGRDRRGTSRRRPPTADRPAPCRSASTEPESTTSAPPESARSGRTAASTVPAVASNRIRRGRAARRPRRAAPRTPARRARSPKLRLHTPGVFIDTAPTCGASGSALLADDRVAGGSSFGGNASGSGAKHDLQRACGLAPPHFDFDGRARLQGADLLDQFDSPRDRFAVERNEHVAGRDSRRGGRALRIDVADGHALFLGRRASGGCRESRAGTARASPPSVISRFESLPCRAAPSAAACRRRSVGRSPS